MAKYKILLQRQKEYQDVPWKGKSLCSTIGTFKVFDEKNKVIYEAASCECGGPSSNEAQRRYRILPLNNYYLKWRESSVTVPKEYKPKAVHLWNDSLPGFENRAILIHIGNVGSRPKPKNGEDNPSKFVGDCIGCILLGKVDNKNGTIGQSTIACKEFYDLVSKNGIENFTLEIKDEV